ncbi:MAG TPA: metalloregulator ArsR/SmtB family transcription factor [Propionibacteriaceae bacterium]
MKNLQRITSDAAAAPQSVETDASTRHRVASSILEHGPSTAAELAERLGLTPAAIRRHLDVLLASGHLEARERRIYGARGRGRPAKVFALTDIGRSVFYTAYDDLAVEALDFLAASSGPDAVTLFAESRMARGEERYRERIANAAPTTTPAQALAAALSEDGYVASTLPSATGEQLCQHHCPVAHVAERFPQICEVETTAFSRLLGVHVQRLATIAHGDGICTTHVPHMPSSSGRKTTTDMTTSERP